MILFVEDLTVIDFSYLCQQRGMLGESWIVDIELEGGLDEQNMVLDFGKVKKQIKNVIDDTVDHKLAIPTQYAGFELINNGQMQQVYFESQKHGMIGLSCPKDAYALIDVPVISKDTIIDYLKTVLEPILPSNVKKLTLNLREEVINGFHYQYSHGLKKHDGNCQRIAHGHRSKIMIFENSLLSPRLNKYWANRWEDIYLGSEEDLVAESESALDLAKFSNTVHCFKYNAMQGEFELVIAKEHCEITDCDTTVECLAQYIANDLKQQDPESDYKVRAFEGVGKGAIAYA
ncbi:6-pyruvoyl trahydropterin synthase family protein [Flocculibacter collagenilyticus]|uniref:6-pyruvoyl trahydropterin synthase family protein n=1 Tax=Flocculibacter collagenilyticus TaxID=2744479 RepID=UPI0018F48B21|nr:6-carboxytetrahydropterin synthase [Flocculibacter collagenilyticus]